jgi:hypothetical protein
MITFASLCCEIMCHLPSSNLSNFKLPPACVVALVGNLKARVKALFVMRFLAIFVFMAKRGFEGE